MLTTAVLGLLNENEILYATRMSRLVTFEDNQALLTENSDPSSSSSADDPDPSEDKKYGDKKSTRTRTRRTYYNNLYNRLATKLTYSSSRVDMRFMKLHEMHAHPNRNTHLHEKLGIKDRLKTILLGPFSGGGSGEGLSQMLQSPQETIQVADVQMVMTEARQSNDVSNSVRLEKNGQSSIQVTKRASNDQLLTRA